jgi:hypothetical protein
MKFAKKPGKEEKSAAVQLRKYLKTDEEMVSLILTYMGMMSMMLDFLADRFGGVHAIHEVPERTQYAMAQAIHHYKLLSSMIRGSVKPEEFEMRWMPIEDDAWKAPEKISDRMASVVKQLYMQLKEEGRL